MMCFDDMIIFQKFKCPFYVNIDGTYTRLIDLIHKDDGTLNQVILCTLCTLCI